MVGIVLVSHSRALAKSVQELVRSMTGPQLPLAIAAGIGDNRANLGTDAVEIAEAIGVVQGPAGVLVLMDIGSAILSAETAFDLLDESIKSNVKLCAAAFVEGAVAAGVTSNLGAPIAEVFAEALGALKGKQSALAAGDSVAGETEATILRSTHQKPAETIRLTVRNPHGLHARPAARLIIETRSFVAEITVRNLQNQRGPVSARSLSRLASLEILQGAEIEVAASGPDAALALKAISQLVETGLGEDLSALDRTRAKCLIKGAAPSNKLNVLPIGVSPGIAIGPIVYFGEAKPTVPQHEIDDIPAEVARLHRAIASAQENLEHRHEQMTLAAGAADARIYEAQILALQDPDWIEDSVAEIKAKHLNAAAAWDQATQRILDRYRSLQDEYLRARLADPEDVGRQVLELLGVTQPAGPVFVEPSILVADDLTPTQVSALPLNLIKGVILLDGGPTAHSSILLKAFNVPVAVQARSFLSGFDMAHGAMIAFDGNSAEIWLNPDDAIRGDLQRRQSENEKRVQEEEEASSQPGSTADGHRIEILANIGSALEAEAALTSGAEGIGLLRTEFLFLNRNSPPSEEEQLKTIRAIAGKIPGRHLVVRTLDIGGDKKLPYLKMPVEENPFLGVRAIRLCLADEELFTAHLRAILRAGLGCDLRIMFPMIATISDLARARDFLENVHRGLEEEAIPHLWPIPTGIMIEIPSAALLAESLAQQADFFSIGTNDLTQYTLAADRGNPQLAVYQDVLDPAVLHLIEKVVRAAHNHERRVAVCGEAAADEVAASVLIGLGVEQLSMNAASIPRIKSSVRRQTLASLQKIAAAALLSRSAAEVRSLFL